MGMFFARLELYAPVHFFRVTVAGTPVVALEGNAFSGTTAAAGGEADGAVD
jgi:hypothetical protein